ncbi:hypothetical protein D3C86_1097430 [compost metagenome]
MMDRDSSDQQAIFERRRCEIVFGRGEAALPVRVVPGDGPVIGKRDFCRDPAFQQIGAILGKGTDVLR